MGLFKPGWMSRDEGKALRSLDKVSRDEELYRIVLECPHGSVRMRALSRIRDAGRRLDLVLTAQAVSFDERLAALEGATEEGLCRAAREAPSCDIRLEAVGRMSDSLLLAELVKEGAGGSRDDRRVCEAAYEKMTRPPFECSMLMHGRKAEENLIRDIEEMVYPDDRDRLLRAARERDGESGGRAVSALPYEGERDALRDLALNGKGPAFLPTAISWTRSCLTRDPEKFSNRGRRAFCLKKIRCWSGCAVHSAARLKACSITAATTRAWTCTTLPLNAVHAAAKSESTA